MGLRSLYTGQAARLSRLRNWRPIDENTALISVTTTNSLGVLQEVERIGSLAGKYKIPYLVDAAGTLGAVTLDVQKIGCDFLSASGRKYLKKSPSGTRHSLCQTERIGMLKGICSLEQRYLGLWD